MNRTARTQPAHQPAANAVTGAARSAVRSAAAAPDSTWEAGVSVTGYDGLGAARQFQEPVRGLRIRELLAPGVFRRFFGASGAP